MNMPRELPFLRYNQYALRGCRLGSRSSKKQDPQFLFLKFFWRNSSCPVEERKCGVISSLKRKFYDNFSLSLFLLLTSAKSTREPTDVGIFSRLLSWLFVDEWIHQQVRRQSTLCEATKTAHIVSFYPAAKRNDVCDIATVGEYQRSRLWIDWSSFCK